MPAVPRRPVVTLPAHRLKPKPRMSRPIFWALVTAGLSISIVLGVLFPFPAIIVLTIVAVLFLR